MSIPYLRNLHPNIDPSARKINIIKLFLIIRSLKFSFLEKFQKPVPQMKIKNR